MHFVEEGFSYRYEFVTYKTMCWMKRYLSWRKSILTKSNFPIRLSEDLSGRFWRLLPLNDLGEKSPSAASLADSRSPRPHRVFPETVTGQRARLTMAS